MVPHATVLQRTLRLPLVQALQAVRGQAGPWQRRQTAFGEVLLASVRNSHVPFLDICCRASVGWNDDDLEDQDGKTVCGIALLYVLWRAAS